MIVEPDFPDHWKTRMLVALLDGDLSVPMCVIRLWAHCQNRKQWIFNNLSDRAIKAICGYSGDPEKLVFALEESGFIDIYGDNLEVHGWAEVNAKLVKNWDNGGKGGRPKKPAKTEPNKNPIKTQSEPSDNPPITQAEPIEKIDKIEKNLLDADKPPPKKKAAELQKRAKSLEELAEYLKGRGLLKSDAEWLWNKWEANGWKRSIGNKEVPVESWKHTVCQWDKMGLFPSQKQNKYAKPPTPDTGPPIPKKLVVPEPANWKQRVPGHIAERGWEFLCKNDHESLRRILNGESLVVSEPIDFEAAVKTAG